VGAASPERRESQDRALLFYWAGAALVASSVFATRLLPCVDYPQHLALSDVARRLARPGAPESAEFQLSYFTYNGLFHFLVARLSTFLPIEFAGRLVVAASLLALAGAVYALVRQLGRPPWHAALFTPILFSFSMGWGFVNYVLATAIAAWTLVFVARSAAQPSAAAAVAVGAFGLACAFAHVLAMLVLCLAAVSLALEVAWRALAPATARDSSDPIASSGASTPMSARVLATLLRTTAAVGPLLLGCLYCIEVYRVQYGWAPDMYRDPTLEGTAPPLWEKIVWFGAFASDLYSDATDQVLLWMALAMMGGAAYAQWRRSRAERRWWRPASTRPQLAAEAPPQPVVLPFVALTAAYLATPMVFIGTHLIFERLAQWAVLGAVLAMPSFPAVLADKARRWMLALGLLAGANTLAHCALFAWETNDASRVIDDLPPGRAATAIVWDPWTWAYRNGTLTHLAAYYGARKHGRWAFAFARYLSVPVRFKDHTQPAWPARGWEFDAEAYDPRCRYARAFPLVIVKAPAEVPRSARGEAVVRDLVFRRDAGAVRLLSHHGRFWAFDTTGLPDDGIP
jgi:hypothetical protein